MIPIAITTRMRRSRLHEQSLESKSIFEVKEKSDAKRYLLYADNHPEKLLQYLWSDPDMLIQKGQPLKLGNRTSVVKLQLTDRAYVVKRYNLRNNLHTFVHGFLRSRARRCWESALLLHEQGINTPRPVAFLEQRIYGLGMRSFLVTEYEPGKRLCDYFSQQRFALARSANNQNAWLQNQHQFLKELSSIWNKLAAGKLTHGDMKLANFLVSESGTLSLIDLDSMRKHNSDLTWEWARRKDWMRLLRDLQAYPEFIQNLRVVTRAQDPALIPAREELHCNELFQHLLRSHGLNSVTEFLQTDRGEMLRRLPDRENWRIDLRGPKDQGCHAYLKKHRPHQPSLFKPSWISSSEVSPGEVEAENIRALEAYDIPTMTLIAHGKRVEDNGRQESFVLTEELKNFQQLDLFLEERFGAATDPRDPNLKKLLNAVAEVASRFHAAGFNHRDFYTCHFFVKEQSTPDVRFEVRLIDLQRVQRRKHSLRRWIVKDLAQLAYSSPKRLIDCGMRMRFVKRYFAIHKLGPAEKKLIRSVVAKENFMKWKLGAYR